MPGVLQNLFKQCGFIQHIPTSTFIVLRANSQTAKCYQLANIGMGQTITETDYSSLRKTITLVLWCP